ncbi:MAG: glycosyltransferase [Burkholderiales bacterium]|nr:glycosyltransferase [Burkholderiales bacterium]
MSLTVVIPALNEERHIAGVVRAVRDQAPQVPVIVIDDGSTDRTAECARAAGARVVTSTLLGKGASMEDGLQLVQTPWVLFLDGDLSGLRPDLVQRMTEPLAAGRADLVKARFARSGGRVTELTAKPLLRVFFPELMGIEQPLGGIIAGSVAMLRSLTLEDDYGVDVGLLIDAHLRGARIEQVDIGEVAHDSQSLARLGQMAQQVSRTIMQRAKASSRFSFEQFQELEELERHARGTFERLAEKLSDASRVALISAEGPLAETDYLLALARSTGREAELARVVERQGPDLGAARVEVARLFRFVHQNDFVRVARSLPLRGDAVSAVNALRRAGWRVGVVSDGFFIAADILRRRVFADFAVAHFMNFRNGVSSGELRLNPAFVHSASPVPGAVDKGHVLRQVREQLCRPGTLLAALGALPADQGLLQAADLPFALGSRPTETPDACWAAVDSLTAFSERVLAVG